MKAAKLTLDAHDRDMAAVAKAYLNLINFSILFYFLAFAFFI